MKYLIDCGHALSGADTGAEGCGRKEQGCTREIGYKVKAKLETLGHTVHIVSCDNCSSLGNSLRYRVETANSLGGDLYISIHLNASTGAGHGTEVYTYSGKAFEEARNVLENISNLGYSNRGIKDGSGLYVIRNTSMKSMLIECCFIDNESDMARYNAEDIANAIVKGLTGSTTKATSSQPIVTPVAKKASYSRDNWISRLQAECNKQGFSNQTVDGIAGPNTLNGCPTLREGARGNITKLLQEKLGIPSDGIFGNQTKAAVMQYQSLKMLSVDGIVGRNTWRKLLGM